MSRLLVGLPLMGPVLAGWVIDVEAHVAERDGQVVVALRMRTTLPQRVGRSVTSQEMDAIVADVQRLLPTVSVAPSPVADPIVGPGQAVPDAFTGTLRDYSRCASLADLSNLRSGDFPLGRYLWPAEDSVGTAPLFLGAPRNASGALDEHLIFRNVCVTAPVGSGKTHSVFRPWAIAAARAGFSTLVFDPKGDLAPALRTPSFEAGNRVVVFSTSPEQPSVAWNFMDEIAIAPNGELRSRRPVDGLVEALIPSADGGNSGRDRDDFARTLFRGWLGGFLQIAKYALGESADPATVYQMARDQARLTELLERVKACWPNSVYERLRFEVIDLYDKHEWGYSAQLRGVANALTPFVHEPLRTRTRARPGQRTFRISELDRRPTTLILSCPLRDGDAARRTGSIAAALLLAHVYERPAPADGMPDTRLPMVLLLDETRLLNVNLAEFLSVGRGFKVGVVTCYQELDQIRDEGTRRELLTNSNTLIALRGVGPGSRAAIAERLADASVQVATAGVSTGEEGRQHGNVNMSREQVAVLGDYELRALPGPRHTALVHIQDGTVREARPFLVDLTTEP